jgi:amino acid adenylation domain-containing protein
VADTNAPVIVTQQHLAGQLPEHDGCLVRIDADWEQIAQHPDTAPLNTTLPGNLAYIIYTSGSTGRPKGVTGLHQGMVNRIVAQASIAAFENEDVCCQKTSIGFVDSIFEVLGPLSHGLQLVIADPAAGRDPVALAKLIADADVTRVVMVPSLASTLVSEPTARRWLSGLKVCTLSGEAFGKDLLQHLIEALPGCRFVNLYGSSEASADVSYYVAGEWTEGVVPIGRPISNTQAYVLDGFGEVSPTGVAGELYVGGAGLARGYLGRPDLTAERFVPSPFGDGARLYRTGDLVRYLPDGNLEFLGRIDHQVKLRGYRIELGEIEAALVQHPDVDQAVVTAREDSPGDKRLVAYVVGNAEVDVLRGHLKQSLPDYMVPSAFVMLEALPLSPNGKIDRKALPAPEQGAVARSEYVAPRTPTEEVLASIWGEVLKLDRVGIEDNFFELGGHSLLAVRVMARVRDALEMELPLRVLFEAPTIRELTEWIEIVRWVSQPNMERRASLEFEEGVL